MESSKNLYLIVVEKEQEKDIASKAYMSTPPMLYKGPFPKRTIEIDQIVSLTYNRYPTLFKVVDVFESKLNDTLAIISFNWDTIKNHEDINR